MRKVLFVCSGNQCRSPLAEAVMNHRARQRGMEVDATSAGTLMIEGISAHPDTVRAAAAVGLDLESHLSRGATAAVVAQADLVIGMARKHVAWLSLRFPRARIHLFRPWCEGRDDIRPDDDLADPVISPLAAHEACLREIEGLLDQLLARWSAEG